MVLRRLLVKVHVFIQQTCVEYLEHTTPRVRFWMSGRDKFASMCFDKKQKWAMVAED